jgi:hypothetical protein
MVYALSSNPSMKKKKERTISPGIVETLVEIIQVGWGGRESRVSVGLAGPTFPS